MRKLFAIILILLIVPFIWGCGGSEHFAEQQIIARAPELLGPADSYRATVRGVSSHHVDYANLIGIGVHPDPNLTIDPLELTLRDVTFRTNPFRIERVGNATFSARISESAVNYFIRQQTRTGTGMVNNAHVDLLRNRVRVAGTLTAAGFVDVPVTTTGHLRVEDGLRVLYVPEKLVLADIPVPQLFQTLLASRVNPILDISGLRFQPQISSLRINSGELIVTGVAELRNLP